MLCQSTCVGLRYGHLLLTRDFSWQRRVGRIESEDPFIPFSELPYGFSCMTPYQVRHTQPKVCSTYLPASSLRFKTTNEEYRPIARPATFVGDLTNSVVAEYERHVHRLRFSASA